MVRELEERQPAPSGEEPVRLEDLVPPEELERFRAELKKSHEQAAAGQLIPSDAVLAEL